MITIRFSFVIMLVLCLGMGTIFGQDKDKKDKDKDAEKQAANDTGTKEKWNFFSQITVVLKEVRETDKSVVISIQNQVMNPNAQMQISQASMTMRQANTPQARAQAQRALMVAQRAMYTIRMEDVELLMKDDVKIRQLTPPEAFDDKGNKKKYTTKELKELKGDDAKSPGYPAEYSDLVNQSIVTLTLMIKPQKAAGGGKATGLVGVAAKNDDPDVARELRPKIASIMILGRVPDNNKKGG